MGPTLGPECGPHVGPRFGTLCALNGPCVPSEGTCMFSKGPCMFSKGPCMFSEGPCMASKGTCKFSKRPCVFSEGPCMFSKAPVCSRKDPVCPHKGACLFSKVAHMCPSAQGPGPRPLRVGWGEGWGIALAWPSVELRWASLAGSRLARPSCPSSLAHAGSAWLSVWGLLPLVLSVLAARSQRARLQIQK